MVFVMSGLVFSQSVPAQAISGIYLAQENDIRTLWEISESSDPENSTVSITDIFGAGFLGERSGNQVSFESGGNATVSGNGNISIQASGRNILLQRVATTDSSFPLRRAQPYQTPAYFSGPWDIEEISIDLVTGETLPQFDGSLVFIDVFTLSHEGEDALRFNDSLNTWFQGVPLNGQDYIFRVIKLFPVTPEPGFETIAGSDNNFPRQVLGQGHFPDINHFTVDLVLQTLSTANPEHFLLNILGSRRNPFPEGDVNLDRDVNGQDRDALVSHLGFDKFNEGYSLAADLDGNGLVDFADLDLFDNTPSPQKAAGPWMTGMWFDPARSGEGFHLFVLDDERAVVTWFSWGPDGGQAWFLGIGRIENNSIIVSETEITSGTVFGDDFDPGNVIRADWGSIRISHEDCDHASVTFAGTDQAFGNGGYRLQRLSTPRGVNCENMTTSGGNSGRFTSAWFDPSRSGEGWFFEELTDGRVLVTWYTYDLEGKQMWLLGVGTTSNGAVEVPEMLSVSGGAFGPAFDPEAISETPWGSLRFEKTTCPAGQISYQALDPEFGSATREVVLLAGVEGLDCTD